MTKISDEIRKRWGYCDELDEMVDAASNADDTCEKLADLADRIRKLAKEQGNE